MIDVETWSTGQYIGCRYATRREAFTALRAAKPSYFDQLFYIRANRSRNVHKYTLPAFCTFTEFLDNIGEHVKITRIA